MATSQHDAEQRLRAAIREELAGGAVSHEGAQRLKQLAGQLGIPTERAAVLFNEVEAALAGQQANEERLRQAIGEALASGPLTADAAQRLQQVQDELGIPRARAAEIFNEVQASVLGLSAPATTSPAALPPASSQPPTLTESQSTAASSPPASWGSPAALVGLVLIGIGWVVPQWIGHSGAVMGVWIVGAGAAIFGIGCMAARGTKHNGTESEDGRDG